RCAAELLDELPHGLGDVGNVVEFEFTQLLDTACVTDGFGHHGADTGLDVEIDADGLERHDDVAEEDRGIDAVPAYRLHRDLGVQVGACTAVKHRHVGANMFVLEQGASGLAQETNRYVRNREAPAGAKERRILQRHTPIVPCPSGYSHSDRS